MDLPEHTKNFVDTGTKIDQKIEEVKEKLDECDSVIKKEFIMLRATSVENKKWLAKITDNVFGKIIYRLKEKLELYTLSEIEQYEKAAFTRDCIAILENLFVKVHEADEVPKGSLEKFHSAISKYYEKLGETNFL